MAHRLFRIAVLSQLLASAIGCSDGGRSGPSAVTTTVATDPTFIADFYRMFPPSETHSEEDLGGFVPEGFTVQGPGTVVVRADWSTLPANDSARVVLMLFRADGSELIRDSSFNGLCAGIANEVGYGRPKELRHEVGSGEHRFFVMVRSFGPASANVSGAIRFEPSS